MEVPSPDGGPTGYFTNAVFAAFWHHTEARGAGEWHRPGFDNLFFFDTPSFDLYCPPPLSEGTITWIIPIAWGELSASGIDDIVKALPQNYSQVYTLDGEGGMRIDKFGQWIKMAASGAISGSSGIRLR